MSELIQTVQLQTIGDALIELFELTLPSGTTVYLHNGLKQGDEALAFSNKAGTVVNEYTAIPIEMDGIEFKSDGPLGRPSLSMANVPILTRQISSKEDTMYDILQEEGVEGNEDLLNTKVVYRRTLQKYLSSSAGATPSVPIEFPSQTYVIDRVAGESNIIVNFELASPIDIEAAQLPYRQIIGKYCSWEYQGQSLGRGGGCNWSLDGRGRFFDSSDSAIDMTSVAEYVSTQTYSINGRVKTIETDNGLVQVWEALRSVPISKDPRTSRAYWKRIDLCGKLMNSCKIRFQGNNDNAILNTNIPLPFGGFPGTKKFR